MYSEQNKKHEVSPLISVVLPVYNGGKYIAEALESILSQTFSDYELIVIDDGSTDDTYRILQEYQAKDYRVCVVSRENRGLIATLNEGVALARGTWLARMDSDDVALPCRFERQLEELETTGADICGSWVQRFGTLDKRVVRFQQSDEAIKMEMLFSTPFAHPSVMMRTSMIKRLQYDPAWKTAEDYDLWERAIEDGYSMTNVPEILLRYRVHAEQVSTQFQNIQRMKTQEIRRRYWVFIFHSMQLNEEWIDETLRIFSPPLFEVNMDIVDASFAKLLQQSDKESRGVISSHITRLYIKAAASCPDIVCRWDKLNREFGIGITLSSKLKLWLFRLLRIRENDFLFNIIRKLHQWTARGE